MRHAHGRKYGSRSDVRTVHATLTVYQSQGVDLVIVQLLVVGIAGNCLLCLGEGLRVLILPQIDNT